MKGNVCMLSNWKPDFCLTGIPITQHNDWIAYLRYLANDFLIITSKEPISSYDYQLAVRYKKSVLYMNNNDFEMRIAPYVQNLTAFSLNCKKLRNCELIRAPCAFYAISIFVNFFALIIWVISIKWNPNEVIPSQRVLTILVILKILYDLVELYNAIICTPTDYLGDLDMLLYYLKKLIKPIFEGIFIYFLLHLALVILALYNREKEFTDNMLIALKLVLQAF